MDKTLLKNIYTQKLNLLFIVFVGTLLLTLSAKIKVPFIPVPMTMQTFMVLLLGFYLGPKLGLVTTTLYVFEGALGFPVFTGTPEKGIGISYIIGPTGGYIFGFIISSFIAGIQNYNQSFFSNLFKLFLSVLPIYILGLIWLGNIIGWEKPILELGLYPFIYAEIFKLFLLTAIISKFNFRLFR
ncbi:MAG: BioY family transporter [Candidatus Pelagibacter sp.]|nr:BioY family transporter [Candidatus Pelagibacter sp.]OUV97627.1 MAG: BioY family transporter [Candidatus Pelagibacter sp. TMED142]|tara:strand:- start:193 stop:744 length:552 start_codon:yes stop_codon:yes gene_type:complete